MLLSFGLLQSLLCKDYDLISVLQSYGPQRIIPSKTFHLHSQRNKADSAATNSYLRETLGSKVHLCTLERITALKSP